jgi:hypothetical protein
MDSSSDSAAMQAMDRMNSAAWKSFDRELKSLEDYLASKNHTLSTAVDFLMEKAAGTGKAIDRETVGRRIAELYRLREFLSQQYSANDRQAADSPLAPTRLRRLARA